MIELRYDTKHLWHTPWSNLVPTNNLTSKEAKQVADREALIDRLIQADKDPVLWVQINKGIYKGSIFAVDNSSIAKKKANNFNTDNGVMVYANVDPNNAQRMGKGGPTLREYMSWENLDSNKDWVWAKRSASLRIHAGYLPIKFRTGEMIFSQWLAHDVMRSASLLLDYQGDEVFCRNTKARPDTFVDRLGNDVGIGDLVVVALQYGAGLDICHVRGFSDERRVVIEKIEGGFDRIALEDNATNKIMKMPSTVKSTAVLMKLSRK